MSKRRVVVDGSNIATEGRALPSLSQLRDAVAAWKADNPDDQITVVVDASFSYRIDDSDRAEFEKARTTGELVSPPAGAVGRGDGFLLQIADRTDAVVLSNDSFQEYHGEYGWLFERGRLIGGTPVPGVGWIFSLRTPVRGPKSRESIKEAKKKSGAGRKAKPIEEAIAEATEDVLEPAGSTVAVDNGDGNGRRRRRRRRSSGGAPSPEAVNDPAPFIRFITTYKLGSRVQAVVDRFSSHGAFVTVDETTCYVPLTAMGTPPPRAAREVMKKGETREFVVQALDAQRRGVELAVPGFEHIGGAPTDETVKAEIRAEQQKARKKAAAVASAGTAAEPKKAAKKAEKAAGKKAAGPATRAAKKPAAGTTPAPKKQAPPAKKAATKKAATKKAAASPQKAPARKKQAPPAKKAATTKAPTKKAAAKKVAAKKAPAQKAAKNASKKSSR
ncbi:MAG TPA: S1 RNA-binding domain-containing protein [Acidimicrobiales bacterium]|nr:S1 RNA-binding domain-containing protein [Acidimicrobiales bacterium]